MCCVLLLPSISETRPLGLRAAPAAISASGDRDTPGAVSNARPLARVASRRRRRALPRRMPRQSLHATAIASGPRSCSARRPPAAAAAAWRCAARCPCRRAHPRRAPARRARPPARPPQTSRAAPSSRRRSRRSRRRPVSGYKGL
eukprot:scaffold4078_cov68-Phaeocystis_antarctica.AAC.25